MYARGMSERANETPHYLRFAQALALVSIAAASTGCTQVRQAIGCEHCHCGGSASLDRPIDCDHVDPNCCMVIEGPLPPPDLAAGVSLERGEQRVEVRRQRVPRVRKIVVGQVDVRDVRSNRGDVRGVE